MKQLVSKCHRFDTYGEYKFTKTLLIKLRKGFLYDSAVGNIREYLYELAYNNDDKYKCKITNKWIRHTSTSLNVTNRQHDGYYYLRISGLNAYSYIEHNDCKYFLQISHEGLIHRYGNQYLHSKHTIKNMFAHVNNEFTIAAFDIPDNVVEEYLSSKGVTLTNMIEKYGEEVGTKKYNDYCRRQARSNTFEYKHKKHGWTYDEFKSFNLSRAITLTNMIEKYGEEVGTKKYNDYCKKQSHTSTNAHIEEKYGADRLQYVIEARKKSKKFFIMKHGEELGIEKFNEHVKESSTNYSKESIRFFNKLIRTLHDNNIADNFLYGPNEHTIYDPLFDKRFSYDFTSTKYNFIIEYHGDMWHANPQIYESTDTHNPFNSNLLAHETWSYDSHKKHIAEHAGFNVFVVWSSDAHKDSDKTIDILLNNIKNTL